MEFHAIIIVFQAVDIRQIYDKFPEKKGGLKELYSKGPQSVFFLVKFWVRKSSSIWVGEIIIKGGGVLVVNSENDPRKFPALYECGSNEISHQPNNNLSFSFSFSISLTGNTGIKHCLLVKVSSCIACSWLSCTLKGTTKLI